MRFPLRLLTGLFVLTCGAWAVVNDHRCEAAQEAAPLIETTDTEQSLQGEYSGRVRDWYGYVGRAGLQLAARGDGKFSGTLFLDGLPFDGWDRRNSWEVSGTLEGERLVLTTADGQSKLRLRAGREFAWLEDAEGRVCAGLSKVRRRSRTLGAQPPRGVSVLFDGERLEGLEGAKINDAGNLSVGFTTVDPVQDFELHVEFRLPFEPNEEGQGRGNSGVYIQRRYEVQILDSFASGIEFNGCASLYRQRPPAVNASLPPGQWQTYDIHFQAARWNEAGEKSAPARISVWHNGILVHNQVEIETKTGAGQPESPEPLPILFQDHRNQVEFRNLWIVKPD
ncbi:MAG: DUF1080 domain-containing protein [Pirellulaceae bacterium]|nr:DUF1080 domain-containing protein [Planctomycetales bacterium]